ncbi:class I SAM-dependent methyltransferase [Nocardia rosealba]|uniref:class I SAM-dependent methyltransferase n=1 Tax=Nocardia rosealba TaxID=2878563 RepID=UPI001CD9A010|nr:methyltransferase domain-containing protein [Nocardia rosealba]MCA2207192.1 methyltransferase C-terminal domain-containing protein [Nocardia rosealba]
MTRRCRGCGDTALRTLLDLGTVPAADHFPSRDSPVQPAESGHPLRMDRCTACGLAQLADDDTVTAEPRGIEPQALRDQAADAIDRVRAAGLLAGATVTEFGSPHGGTWLPLPGFTEATGPADVVLDCFGIMHEPDQRAAFAARAAATAPAGVLLVQFHSLAAIVAQGQWNALRHGHFAYYSLASLRTLLAAAGMSVVTAWEFDLYGGTVLVAARHGSHPADRAVEELLAAEEEVLAAAGGLQQVVDRHVDALHEWLEDRAAQGLRTFAYGAASRAVALLAMAGAHRELLAGVADASPGKQGRRMPGTDVPIISPADLVAAEPDAVLLTLPDLLREVRTSLPQLDGRWFVDDPLRPRKVDR